MRKQPSRTMWWVGLGAWVVPLVCAVGMPVAGVWVMGLESALLWLLACIAFVALAGIAGGIVWRAHQQVIAFLVGAVPALVLVGMYAWILVGHVSAMRAVSPRDSVAPESITYALLFAFTLGSWFVFGLWAIGLVLAEVLRTWLRRARMGVCRACGYDLRGLRARAICPECGMQAS